VASPTCARRRRELDRDRFAEARGDAQILEEAGFTPAEIEDLGEERAIAATV
jgi:hypothetical protein